MLTASGWRPGAACPLSSWLLADALKQHVLLPSACNVQLAAGQPDALEVVLLENALRSVVVDKRRCLQAMQLERTESLPDDSGHRPGRQPATIAAAVHPLLVIPPTRPRRE
jgi:hypothetical protein